MTKNDAIQYGRVAYTTLDIMREAAPESFDDDIELVMNEVQAIMADIEEDGENHE